MPLVASHKIVGLRGLRALQEFRIARIDRSRRRAARVKELALAVLSAFAPAGANADRTVEITFEEDRQYSVINGPRAYFHDPVGTGLEFIDLTSYVGNQL